MKSPPIARLPEPPTVRFAPPDSIRLPEIVVEPEPIFRLIACAFVPSLKFRSPPTLKVRAPTWIVWVAAALHSPAILPAVARDPPALRVRDIALTLMNE